MKSFNKKIFSALLVMTSLSLAVLSPVRAVKSVLIIEPEEGGKVVLTSRGITIKPREANDPSENGSFYMSYDPTKDASLVAHILQRLNTIPGIKSISLNQLSPD